MKGLPPPAPPYTRGETDARRHYDVTVWRYPPPVYLRFVHEIP